MKRVLPHRWAQGSETPHLRRFALLPIVFVMSVAILYLLVKTR